MAEMQSHIGLLAYFQQTLDRFQLNGFCVRPKEVGCSNFLNADYLALGLSPLSPEIATMKAGRLLLAEFKSLVARRETFAAESTLSGISYLRLLRAA